MVDGAQGVVEVEEFFAARRAAVEDHYVPYDNLEGFVDLSVSRSMFMVEQPNLAATCGLDAPGKPPLSLSEHDGTLRAMLRNALGGVQGSWAAQRRRMIWPGARIST